MQRAFQLKSLRFLRGNSDGVSFCCSRVGHINAEKIRDREHTRSTIFATRPRLEMIIFGLIEFHRNYRGKKERVVFAITFIIANRFRIRVTAKTWNIVSIHEELFLFPFYSRSYLFQLPYHRCIVNNDEIGDKY